MYTAEQRQDHVRELQEYLRTLSAYDPRHPRIGVDGQFGAETEEAVRVFQELYGAPVTGVVERADWERILAAYRATVSRTALPIFPFPSPDFVLTPASRDPIVAILQVMINTVGQTLVAVTGLYDEPTIQAIRLLQFVGELPVTGLVDLTTWNLLATLYNAR